MQVLVFPYDLKSEYQNGDYKKVEIEMFSEKAQAVIRAAGIAEFFSNGPRIFIKSIRLPEPPVGNCSHPECPQCDGIEVVCTHQPPAEQYQSPAQRTAAEAESVLFITSRPSAETPAEGVENLLRKVGEHPMWNELD